ncbi:MAG TPA: Uma2 family endonuclease [Kamptonema sp.]|nr:Uma2 family endonuclease [Kamptonema sp.]
MSMTIADIFEVQAQLEANGKPYQIELHEGEIIVMGPSDIVASFIGTQFGRLLANWIYPRQLGMVFDSSGGFILPNSDLRAPDVAFVSRQRLPRSVRYFAEVVPNLVVEIKSQSDRIPKLQAKLQMYLQQGAEIGILVDPDREWVEVYRPNGSNQGFGNGDILTLPDLLPGWELSISELWPPVFDRE